jgi:hypothetical protein
MDGATPTADWLSDFFDSFDADDVGAFDGANAFADVPTEVIGGEGARVRAAGTKRKATEEADGSQDERVAVTATSVAATTAAATTATGRSNVLSEGAKKTKSTREKRRRDVLNSRFEELSAVLEPGESQGESQSKATVVFAATELIKRLRVEHARLANMIMRFQEDNLLKTELTQTLAAERDQLMQEKTHLLREKLRIEAQLQGFLTSMPFASPADGMVSTKSASGVAAWTVPMPFMPASEEGEDVTLRAPVA